MLFVGGNDSVEKRNREHVEILTTELTQPADDRPIPFRNYEFKTGSQ